MEIDSHVVRDCRVSSRHNKEFGYFQTPSQYCIHQGCPSQLQSVKDDIIKAVVCNQSSSVFTHFYCSIMESHVYLKLQLTLHFILVSAPLPTIALTTSILPVNEHFMRAVCPFCDKQVKH